MLGIPLWLTNLPVDNGQTTQRRPEIGYPYLVTHSDAMAE